MMRMPKKMKEKWLKALRSGEYGQTKHVLTDGKGNFCCLGVLQHCTSGGKVQCYDDGSEDFMEVPTPEWYTANGCVTFVDEGQAGDTDTRLIRMNDGGLNFKTGKKIKPKSFKQIANWIEKNIEGY